MRHPVNVDIWSDIVCPWCYIGKRRFERALAGFDHRDAVTIVHRSFQLNPHAERGDAMIERLYKAYFTERRSIVDEDSLVALAAEAGLAAAEARRVLKDGDYADEVAADGHQAAALGATGVPFFAIGGRYGVSGAQSPEVFLETLNRAWTDTQPTDTLRG